MILAGQSVMSFAALYDNLKSVEDLAWKFSKAHEDGETLVYISKQARAKRIPVYGLFTHVTEDGENHIISFEGLALDFFGSTA